MDIIKNDYIQILFYTYTIVKKNYSKFQYYIENIQKKKSPEEIVQRYESSDNISYIPVTLRQQLNPNGNEANAYYLLY